MLYFNNGCGQRLARRAKRRMLLSLAKLLLVATLSPALARAASPADEALSPVQIRTAIEASLALIEKSTGEYRGQRECFSCHHQALPVLALISARDHGFAIDEENLQKQLDHTLAHLQRGRDDYLEGRGQGGKADTAGWALWTLEAGGRTPDETTAAVVDYLLDWQKDLGRWQPPSRRPPTEASEFTTTYVALRGLQYFATPEQQERVAARREGALSWLLETKPEETEDHVFRLRALHYLTVEEAVGAARELLAQQREDGGWAQTDEAQSDAYATGTVLAALHETESLWADDAAYRRGLGYLLRSQLDDGSWKVETRSKPIQRYFESGFPHGEDQFISISATCWAMLALLNAAPPPSQPAP